MKVRARRFKKNITDTAGFSMVEMLLVIGIIGIVVGVGAISYVKQINRSRVDTALQIINANMVQARQVSIARRQSTRVAIDAGALDGFPDSLTGTRTRRASIWREAKRQQQYEFDVEVPAGTGTRDTIPNAYLVGDPDYFPEAVMIADVDNRFPGIGGNPEVFYVEFSPRGSIRKVYFQGEEPTTNYNEIAPIIHIARAGEMFTINGKDYDYLAATQVNLPEDDQQERYKVQTLEVVRLTGRTRLYDYAIMNPWPIDELVIE